MARARSAERLGGSGKLLLVGAVVVWLSACQTKSPPRFYLDGGRLEIPTVTLPRSAAAEETRRALTSGVAEPARFLVELSVQADIGKLYAIAAQRGATKRERRRIVVEALRQVARQSQAELEPLLNRLRERGTVRSYHGFSIHNTVLVEADAEGIGAVARHHAVASIDRETERPLPVWAVQASRAAHRRRSWALDAMGVDLAWQQGFDGSGVVAGIIDSGASLQHEQLRDNFLGGDRGWRDPQGQLTEPRDGILGHGTGVLSCAVGRNVNGITLGVAPAARWVACAAFPDGLQNNIRLTQCADWMLNTAQPDVLINAWILPGEGCDNSLRPLVEAWRAAEILPVFAAGNKGPAAARNHSPANYAGLQPGLGPAFSVGGITACGEVFERSSRGPSACNSLVFPQVVAPASDIIAALPVTASGYIQAEGTSFAAGLAAGAAALLIQRHPEAPVWQLEEALRRGARDRGPPGPDNQFGYGHLYLPTAWDALNKPAATGLGNAPR